MRKSQITPERKQRKKRFFNSICTPPEHPDSPQNLYLWAFSQFSPLLKLNRSRWLTGQIIEYAVNALNFINNTVHNLIQYCIRNLCGLCCHEVDSLHCTKCYCIIISSEIAHNAYTSHIGKCCEVLVRHPGWFFSMFFLIVGCCFVDFFTINEICILYNANFLFGNFSDNTDSKSRSREWLTEYQSSPEFQAPDLLYGLHL